MSYETLPLWFAQRPHLWPANLRPGRTHPLVGVQRTKAAPNAGERCVPGTP
jgi:hypothetical protein